ncbi:major facilitator superfamily domain-containing protein [Leptodontidium sp. MPI-SDFR-AT-0119]|nr:major facilitator superfamily domain-containing protein [Leptodontidium sp. MPI-SDFR-AT-0119]
MDKKSTTEKATATKDIEAKAITSDPDRRRREKRLVRKLDLTLLPMVWVLYMFNYLDRNAIAQAKLNNIESDLGLVGDQFNTAISILNVGYMLMQLPSNMILTRVRPSLYMPFWVCVWSCISASTAGASNYTHLVVIRFFLGLSEAPFFPGAFYLLSCWYTRRELGLRTAVLYSGLVLATCFSGLISAGIFAGLDGAHGLAGWQWLFIITGAISFVLGLLATLILPDFPESPSGSGKWLFTQEERDLAIERIRLDRVSFEEGKHSVWYGLKAAAVDYRTWVFVVMLTANHTAYGFNNFFPTIVKGFNLGSRTITLVLTAPPYLVGAVISFIVAFSSDRFGERGFHIAGPMCVAVLGFVISVATLNSAARYAASFFYISGCFAANAMVYSWASSSLSQTPEKRAAAVAMINLLSQLGNIWSPYFFRPGDSPRYLLAMTLMMAFSGLSILTCMVMKWSLRRANQKLTRDSEGSGTVPVLYTL